MKALIIEEREKMLEMSRTAAEDMQTKNENQVSRSVSYNCFSCPIISANLIAERLPLLPGWQNKHLLDGQTSRLGETISDNSAHF